MCGVRFWIQETSFGFWGLLLLFLFLFFFWGGGGACFFEMCVEFRLFLRLKGWGRSRGVGIADLNLKGVVRVWDSRG